MTERYPYGHNPFGAMFTCPACGQRFRTVERLRDHEDFDDDLCRCRQLEYGLDKPGRCNGCQGAGKTPHPATQYPFTVENVREFTTFLTACGGFEIW